MGAGETPPADSDSQEQPVIANLAQSPAPKLASQLTSTLLLISPFFFWGTSMVAMKVCQMAALAFIVLALS